MCFADNRMRGRACLLTAGFALSLFTSGGASADQRREVLPAGTVIPVRLDETLSSKTARPGDRFTATVRYGREDAGLPEGTRVEGVVREALPAADGKPGVLDMDFRRMVFPNGEARPFDGALSSLDGKSVRRDSYGRLVASSDKSKDRLKWVGIGAGAGLLISALTKNNVLLSTLLGGGAGYLYNELTNKKPGDVNLKANSEFGVRLERQFAFYTDRPASAFAATHDRYDARDRDEEGDRYNRRDDRWRERGDTADREEIGVLVDDRSVRFGEARPFQRGSVVFVPIEPVARAAKFDYRYDPERQMIRARGGALRLAVGSRVALFNGERRRLDAAPEVRNGTVYVPMPFLALAAGGSAYWDAGSRTVILTTARE